MTIVAEINDALLDKPILDIGVLHDFNTSFSNIKGQKVITISGNECYLGKDLV